MRKKSKNIIALRFTERRESRWRVLPYRVTLTNFNLNVSKCFTPLDI